MEEPINSSSNKERRKKQILFTGGGGGIGGALLLGGAFAAAAAAAFLITSVNKGNKKKPIFPNLKKEFLPHNCESNKEEKEERNEGLLSLLQNPSSSADSYLCVANRIGLTKIDDSMAIETPISEVKLKSSVTGGDEKIVFDNLKAECFDNNVILDRAPIIDFEGLSSPDMEMCVLNQENINKEDCVEDSLFLEAIAMTGEKVELSEIANMVNMIQEEEEEEEEEEEVEESGEEDEDIENDDESTEEEVEDSEGTGGSSRESNAEAIWPVELIEEEQILELKNQQNDGVFLEKIFKTETELEDWDEENNETGFMMMGHDQNAPLIIISKSKFRLLSTLTVGLLLLMILIISFLSKLK